MCSFKTQMKMGKGRGVKSISTFFMTYKYLYSYRRYICVNNIAIFKRLWCNSLERTYIEARQGSNEHGWTRGETKIRGFV